MIVVITPPLTNNKPELFSDSFTTSLIDDSLPHPAHAMLFIVEQCIWTLRSCPNSVLCRYCPTTWKDTRLHHLGSYWMLPYGTFVTAQFILKLVILQIIISPRSITHYLLRKLILTATFCSPRK